MKFSILNYSINGNKNIDYSRVFIRNCLCWNSKTICFSVKSRIL